MKISEIFYSIQGEGPSAGRPAVFVRFQGCNLKCPFCDSKYTWNGNYTEMDASEVIEQAIEKVEEEIGELVLYNDILVVFTGGEPMMYQESLKKCIEGFRGKGFTDFEIETNGTLSPQSKNIISIFDGVHFIISPKLNMMDNEEDVDVMKFSTPRTLKFVVEDKEDCRDVMDWYCDNITRGEEIYFMPKGKFKADLEKNSKEIVEMCKKYGVKFTPRLHIDIYGNARGK